MTVLRSGTSVVDFEQAYIDDVCPACLHPGSQAIRYGYPHGHAEPALEVVCARCGYQIVVMKPCNAPSLCLR